MVTSVKAGSIALSESDYTVRYSSESPVSIGSYTVTVTGEGNFTGSARATYTIGPATITSVTLAEDSLAYTGRAQIPEVALVRAGSLVLRDYDYAFECSSDNPAAVGTYKVIVTGRNNYTGAVEATYRIVPASGTGAGGSAGASGSGGSSGAGTGAGSSSTAAGASGGGAGAAASGTGAAGASGKPASISTASISGLAAKTFTGKAISQVPTVRLGSTTLRNGIDFTFATANNKNAGTATITVTGKGNYAGTAKATFRINKAKNPAKVKASTKTVKYSKLKKKAQATKPLSVTKAQGKVSFAKVAKGSSKKLSINKKTGKVAVKKGTKKGVYKLKVKVSVAGGKNYKPFTKTVTMKVRVK